MSSSVNFNPTPSPSPTPVPTATTTKPASNSEFFRSAFGQVLNLNPVKKFFQVMNDGKDYASEMASKMGDQLSNNEFLKNQYNNITHLIKDNALGLSYAGAGVGSLMVTDSVINLMRENAENPLVVKKEESSSLKEALKMISGSALIGLGLTYGTKDPLEKAKIVHVALGVGLIHAAWRASIVAKPTFLVLLRKMPQDIKDAAAAISK